jgi:hypothetical protein
MPASFDDPQSDRPKPPPPPQSEVKDENLGTVIKIGGSTFAATCLCGCGAIILIVPLMYLSYGFNPFTGFLALLGLVLSIIGFYVILYGWRAAEEGSKW